MGRDWPLAATRVALLAVVAAFALLTSGCGKLDKDAVSTELKTLQSSTAEGMLVAKEAARSRAPADFIEIRTAELAKQSRNSADALAETPAESGLQQAAMRGNQIGNRAAELLDALHADPGNSNLAANVTNGLSDLNDQASKVGESL